MILINTGLKETPFKNLADEHFSRLNFKSGTNELDGRGSLIQRIQDKIQEYNENGEMQKREFLDLLLEDNYQLLRRIVTASADELEAVIDEVSVLLKERGLTPLFEMTKTNQPKAIGFGAEMLEVFDYDAWRGSVKADWLFTQVNLQACPYCNSRYISKDEEMGKLLVVFDHFYSKSRHPYLSLSFFNLIPSCGDCNTNYKGTKEFSISTHIHPYVNDFNSLSVFKAEVDFENGIAKFDIVFEIIPDLEDSHKANESAMVLSIQGRHDNPTVHNGILTLYNAAIMYTDDNLEEFSELTQESKEITIERLKARIDKLSLFPREASSIRYLEFAKIKRDVAIKFGLM